MFLIINLKNPFWNHVFVKKQEAFELRHEISNNVVCATSKGQISLRIHAVWSESLVVAWIFYGS